MNEIILLISILLIFLNKEIYIYSKFIYLIYKLKKNKIDMEKLEIDSESIIFLTPTPTNNLKYLTSLPKDFILKYKYVNFLMPTLDCITIYYLEENSKNLIGIILLEEKVFINKIDMNNQDINFLLLSKILKEKILFEVCNKLRKNKD